MLNETIDKEALRKAIYHNTGWNFMCPPENIDEINRYCETGDFDLMSPETLRQLNGIYRYIAEDYSYFTGGKYLPNIFVTEEGI
jgi:hypothetical protein